ncbi:hypothetical protein M899_3102 [Bacteriovorax sp. BSW11_IV]|uniref:hypothetical protein n=1 Tax=Bacteriovorax sp. BSW11_IV TaxID=1353529 RepID=UPI00038A32F5|nr:hypothetical protein [Bacteriovorax sp. BSW11_IV]EQC49556.1 hypothetical protein M899_3102 [Bacteriovorax sp. BSW11_IV]
MRKSLLSVSMLAFICISNVNAFVCDQFVFEAKASGIEFGLNDSAIDVLSSLASLKHEVLMQDVDNGSLSHSEAQAQFQEEVLVRECAQFYGNTKFSDL